MAGHGGAGSRTHLDTAVVSIPVCARGQALQWVCEAPTILPGWTLAVHNLEGLELIRGGEGPRAGSSARKVRQDNSRAGAAGVREIHWEGGEGQWGTHHRLVLAGVALGRRLSRSTLLLTDLCTGQELAQLLHAAEEAQTPLTLPGGRGEGRGGRGLREQLQEDFGFQLWPPQSPHVRGQTRAILWGQQELLGFVSVD